MSAHRTHLRFALRILVLTACVLAHGSGVFAWTSTGYETDQVPLDAGATWRDPGRAETSAVFTIDAESRGILGIELVADRAYLASPRAQGGARSALLHRGATTQLLLVEAGRTEIRVASTDPARALEPFRLITRFVDISTHVDDVTDISDISDTADITGLVEKDEDDTEIEIEPEGFVACTPGGPAILDKDEDDTEIEIEPEGFRWCLEPGSDSAPTVVRAARRLLCGAGLASTTDDHADGLLCASALTWGATTWATAGNGWGDDLDTFELRVPSLGPVEIQAVAEDGDALVDAFRVELFDGAGRRLDGPEAGSLVLPAGTYFVRVAGPEGSSYGLRVGRPGR